MIFFIYLLFSFSFWGGAYKKNGNCMEKISLEVEVRRRERMRKKTIRDPDQQHRDSRNRRNKLGLSCAKLRRS
jgi:hypothetical protein